MAQRARFYDGETAQVHEVSARPTTSELVIFRPADSGIVARWPIGELAVLGDLAHEAVPPVVRRGSEARLLVDDPELRRQLAALVPQLSRLAASPPAAARRIAVFGVTLAALVSLFWFGIDYGSEYAAPLLPHTLQAKLGESVYEELTADKDECHGKAGLAAINGLANRLAGAADYPHEITVHIIKGGPVNAFTLPGGILVVYSDLIDQAKDSAQADEGLGAPIRHRPDRQAGERRLLRSAQYADVRRQPVAGVAQRTRLRAPGRRHRR
jgi:beta-barrel assembly-enhancing protease